MNIKKFFKLDEHKTTVSKEFIAGATTFFAMAYIIFVNPSILGQAGMPTGAVFLATIFATVIGTLIMGLFANVPYALAPGMGLNAFFTFTVCFTFGFSWQEALGLVFICGLINVLITVTKLRKAIIRAIPESLQHAIGGGIGLFIAFIGLINAGLVSFGAGVPALTDFTNPAHALTILGLVIMVVLLILKVKGAILIGIIAVTAVSLITGVTTVTNFSFNIGAPFLELGDTIFAAFGGIKSLFSDSSRLILAILAIFAFSLSDTFDTIGTFIGTGRRSGIFKEEDLANVEHKKGFNSKLERALFADSIATSIGALLGTSNTTTYIESAAGIEEGGRTGLTSVFTASLFILCIFVAPIIGLVPSSATAPALIVVGIMMAASFADINWRDFSESVPAFIAATFMAFFYNISYGIAFAFIFYVITKLAKKQAKDIHPIIWGSAALFLLFFVFNAVNILVG